jgi:hypothetical protein
VSLRSGLSPLSGPSPSARVFRQMHRPNGARRKIIKLFCLSRNHGDKNVRRRNIISCGIGSITVRYELRLTPMPAKCASDVFKLNAPWKFSVPIQKFLRHTVRVPPKPMRLETDQEAGPQAIGTKEAQLHEAIVPPHPFAAFAFVIYEICTEALSPLLGRRVQSDTFDAPVKSEVDEEAKSTHFIFSSALIRK